MSITKKVIYINDFLYCCLFFKGQYYYVLPVLTDIIYRIFLHTFYLRLILPQAECVFFYLKNPFTKIKCHSPHFQLCNFLKIQFGMMAYEKVFCFFQKNICKFLIFSVHYVKGKKDTDFQHERR